MTGSVSDDIAVLLQINTIGEIVTLEPAAGSTATVLVADLSACQAIVHIIDTILIPKAVSTPALPLQVWLQHDLSQAFRGPVLHYCSNSIVTALTSVIVCTLM